MLNFVKSELFTSVFRRPRRGLVVFRVGLEAAVQDADEPTAELA
jgi:hypothetical protein